MPNAPTLICTPGLGPGFTSGPQTSRLCLMDVGSRAGFTAANQGRVLAPSGRRRVKVVGCEIVQSAGHRHNREKAVDRAEFEASLRQEGYEVRRRYHSHRHREAHAHEFDARIFVLDGAVTLVFGTERVTYRPVPHATFPPAQCTRTH